MYWQRKANHIGALTSFFTGTISWIVLSMHYYPQTLLANEGFVQDAVWDAVYIASTPAFFISVIAFLVVSLPPPAR